MENRKDIGKAFKEKLRDFDQSPDEKLWSAIAADLDKKKKRRAFPFWWTFVAVGILAGIGYLVFNGNSASNVEKTSVPPDMGIINSGTLTGNDSTDENTESNKVAKDNQSNENANTSGNQNSETNVGSENNNISNGIVKSGTNNPTTDNPKGNNIKSNNSSKSGSGDRYATSQPNSKKQGFASGKKKKSGKNGKGENTNPNSNQTGIAGLNAGENQNQPNVSDAKQSNTVNQIEKEKTPGLVALPGSTTSNPGNQTGLIETKTDSSVTEQATQNPIKKDSLKTNPIAKKEESKKDKKQKQQWEKLNLFPYIAPIYSGHTKKYSPIDRTLHTNPTKSEITLAYGAYVSYHATERWSARIGVALINLRFITADRDTLWNQANYRGINYTNNIFNSTIQAASPNSRSLEIIQDISYFEVPIEIKYALRNKKFGVNAYGGLSVMFLGKNKVAIKTPDGQRFEVGETIGLSDNAFSVNAGVGFDYKLSKQLKINLEPIFKYHLLDYNNMPNIKPYTFGVLTGLQFSL